MINFSNGSKQYPMLADCINTSCSSHSSKWHSPFGVWTRQIGHVHLSLCWLN